MATYVKPADGFNQTGKHEYKVLHTLFQIDTKYIPIKQIGRGTYGVVCSSINQEINEKVAIKKIVNVFFCHGDAVRALRELKLLRHLKHENVIALKDVMFPVNRNSFKDVYLVFELMDTDLHQIIGSSQPLSDEHCKYFMFQLLRGLRYLHSANVLHLDLKPENLLVNKNRDLKICDFGLARTCKGGGESMTECVCTRAYRAPELLLGCGNYETSIDVWSVGCIFAEMLGRKPIFQSSESLSQLELITNILGTPSDGDLYFINNPQVRSIVKSLPFSEGCLLSTLFPHADPLGLDLLGRMLVLDPSKRITADEALRHPYMAGLFDQNENPSAQVLVDLDVDEKMDERMMREVMVKEMLHYHPEAACSKVHHREFRKLISSSL